MTEKKDVKDAEGKNLEKIEASGALKSYLKTVKSIQSLRIIDPDIAIFQGSRSEWGSSGGIGYFDQIYVYFHSQTDMREWQWRDRWSESKDRHDLRIDELGRISVELEKERQKVLIEIVNKEYGNRETFFSFEIKKEKSQKQLSPVEQLEFEKLLKNEIARIMTTLHELWECKPQMLMDYSGWGMIPSGSPAYTNYKEPSIKYEIINKELGVSAFITEEQIDNQGKDPQYRYELFVLKHGDQEVKRIFEDHAYEKREGSALIALVDLTPNKVTINTRDGKKTIKL